MKSRSLRMVLPLIAAGLMGWYWFSRPTAAGLAATATPTERAPTPVLPKLKLGPQAPPPSVPLDQEEEENLGVPSVHTRPRPRKGKKEGRHTLQMDLNHNGVVEKDEQQKAFQALDKDGNGRLSPSEMEELQLAIRRTNRTYLRLRGDLDKDGKLSKDERWKLQQPFDANRDGQLDAEERRRWREDWQGRLYGKGGVANLRASIHSAGKSKSPPR